VAWAVDGFEAARAGPWIAWRPASRALAPSRLPIGGGDLHSDRMSPHEINLAPDANRSDEAEELRRELAESQDRVLRMRADFENFRKRVAREREGASAEGRRAALLSVLPVLDSLDRALAAGSTDRDVYEGIVATRRLFVGALRENGVEPIEALGRPFDPNLHEALGAAPAADVAPGTIVEEVRTGWRAGKELLRPSQVIVASGAAQLSAAD
jgi:molecular chaperone GrpE